MASIPRNPREASALSGLRDARALTLQNYVVMKGGSVALGPSTYSTLRNYGLTRATADRAVDDLVRIGLARLQLQRYGAPMLVLRNGSSS